MFVRHWVFIYFIGQILGFAIIFIGPNIKFRNYLYRIKDRRE